MESLGHFLFKYRNLLFPIIIISIIIFFEPRLAFGDVRVDMILDIIGALIMLSGLALRAAVIGYVYIRRGGVNKQVYADKLVTEGVFSLCRNPLYVGNILMVLGFLLIFHNPWTHLIGITAALIFYKSIVTAEESFLLSKFGAEYENYRHNVPRWMFRLKGSREKLADHRFSWSRVILKDYTTAYASVVTILGILVYERLSLPEYADSSIDFIFIGFAFVAATIAFIIVYVLKKRGLLSKQNLATPG